MSPPNLAPPLPALEEARRHHAQGNLLDAAEAYRQTLHTDPQSQSALLGLSLIARQSHQLQPSLTMAHAALAADLESAIAWANLGDALQSLHHTEAAAAAFRHAITLNAQLAAAHYGLGNALALQEDFAAALLSFEAALQLAPGIPEFHFAAAFARGKLADHPHAIAAYRRAIALRPSFAAAWLNLGVELVADGRDPLADLCYRQALDHCQASEHPANLSTLISAHLNFGHLARSRRHFSQAEQHYQNALARAESNAPSRLAEIHVAFAYLHLEQQSFPEAWQSLDLAEQTDQKLDLGRFVKGHDFSRADKPLAINGALVPEGGDPAKTNAEILNAKGILLLAQEANSTQSNDCLDNLDSAIAAFHQAEALGHKTAASNRGNALLRLGRCNEALAAHHAALAQDPHHPGVRYNLALTQLRLGDFAHGWPNYEIRWSFREVHPRPRRFSQPRWHGEPLATPATLFLYGEQGLGDTLQFVRYFDLVAQRVRVPQASNLRPGITILLEVQPSLVRLLTPCIEALAKTHPPLSFQLIASGDPLPHFTHHCPLLSLPAVFKTTIETIPAQIPYLQADPAFTALRAAELPFNPSKPIRIGISWAGNPNYRADHERSTTLATLLPLLKLSQFQWISLQKGEAASQIAKIPANLRPHDGSSADRDFADTAALIANLDLVISTDTAVAHLAAALGKPLWLLLPWQSDWRWMQDRPDTPWYPTAQLFRQPTPNNWPDLIAKVAHELHRFSICDL